MFVCSSVTSRSIAFLLTCLAFAPAAIGARVKKPVGSEKPAGSESTERLEKVSEQYGDLDVTDLGEAGLLQQNEISTDDAFEAMQAVNFSSSGEDNLAQFEAKCPKLYQEPNMPVPNIIHVKILGISNLPWALTDTPDPFVKFWVGKEGKKNGLVNWKNHEKKWLGKSHVIWNNRHAMFNYGCVFFYSNPDADDGNDRLHVNIMDRDVLPGLLTGTRDNFIAQIGTTKDGQWTEGVSMSTILDHDGRLDGDFNVDFSLYKKSKKKLKGNGQTSTVSIQFEVLHDPSRYMLTKAKQKVTGTLGNIE